MPIIRIFFLTLPLLLILKTIVYCQSIILPSQPQNLLLNEGYYSEVAQLDVCSNGKFAISRSDLREDVTENTLKLWDLNTARLLRNLPGTDYALSTDKQIVYLNQVSTNQQVEAIEFPIIVLDLSSLSQIKTKGYKHRINQLSLDGKFALSHDFTENKPQNAFIFELKTNQIKSVLPGKLLDLANDFSTALLEENQEIKIYDIPNKKWLTTLPGSNSWLSPNGQMALSIETNTISIWKKSNNKIFRRPNLEKKYMDCLAISFDGNLIVLKNHEKLDLVNINTHQTISLFSNSEQIYKVNFSKNSKCLAILSSNLTLSIFDIIEHSFRINELDKDNSLNLNISNLETAFDLEASVLIALEQDKFHFWNLKDPFLTHQYSELGQSNIPAHCRINTEGKFLICEEFYDEETRQLVVWDLINGRPATSSLVASLGQDTPALSNLQMAYNYLAVPQKDGYKIYDLRLNKLVLTVPCKSISFSKNNSLVLVNQLKELILFDLITKQPVLKLKSEQPLYNAIISDDGEFIAAFDKVNIKVWEVSSQKEIFNIESTNNTLTKILFSPTRKLLITNHLTEIKLWSLDQKQLIASLQTKNNLLGMFLSKDENTLLLIEKNTGVGNIINIEQNSDVKSIGKVTDSHSIDVNISSNGHLATINGVLWDLKLAKPLTNIEDGYCTLVTDNKAILATAIGYQVWDLKESSLLATFRYYNLGWLVYTPEGFFDGSKDSLKLLSWQLPNWPYLQAMDQNLEKAFYSPNLLNKVLQN